MIELTPEVKEFIEDNIDLIENNCWDQIYDNATFTLDSESTGVLTTILLHQGIDPIELQGLDYIPDYYLSDAPISSFRIPRAIHSLGEGCFSYTGLTSITIPENVKVLRDYVFYECAVLTKVTFEGSCNGVDIGSRVFHGCPDELVIRCKKGSDVDTYAHWMKYNVEYI